MGGRGGSGVYAARWAKKSGLSLLLTAAGKSGSDTPFPPTLVPSKRPHALFEMTNETFIIRHSAVASSQSRDGITRHDPTMSVVSMFSSHIPV